MPTNTLSDGTTIKAVERTQENFDPAFHDQVVCAGEPSPLAMAEYRRTVDQAATFRWVNTSSQRADQGTPIKTWSTQPQPATRQEKPTGTCGTTVGLAVSFLLLAGTVAIGVKMVADAAAKIAIH